MSRLRTKILCSASYALASAAVALVTAEPALSQSEPAAPPTASQKVETVTVTAEKRKSTLKETPISVSVIGQDTLTTTQTTNFDQLARMVPNLIVDDSLGTSFLSISNRGLRTAGSQAGFEGSTAVVIDGVYQARPASLTMALSDVERVEILRGPQGALYGRNASAGVLNIVTRGPGDEFEAYGEVYGGSFDELRLRGAVSGPVVDGLKARANYYHLERDAFAEAVFPGSGDQRISRTGVGLRFDADIDAWTAQLLLRHFELDDATNSQTDLFVVTPSLSGFNEFVIGKPLLNDSIFDRRNDQDFHGFDRLKNNEITLNLRREFGGASFESISGYARYTEESRIDADNTSATGVVIGTNERHQQVSEEMRLSGPLSSQIDYLLGAYFFYQKFDHSEPTILGADWATFLLGAPFLADTEDNAFSKQETRDIAGFAQISVKPIENLTVRGGLRIDSEKKNYDRVQLESFLSPALTVSLDRSVNNWSGSFAAIYALSPDTNVYASVNRGVKSGGFNFGTTADPTSIPFSDEIATNYEVGVRSELLDHRLRLALTAFSSRFADLQVFSFDGTTFRTQNAASADSKGIELEAVGILGEGLEVGVAAGYLDATYAKFPTAQCAATDPNFSTPGCVQDLAGRPLAFAPRYSGNVYADYSAPVWGTWRWHGRADVSFRGTQYLSSTLDPNSRQGGYALVNLRLGVEDDVSGWDIAVVANNALDEDYLQAFFNYPFFAGAYNAQPGQPALYGLVVRKSF